MYRDISVYKTTTKPMIQDLESIAQSLINLIETRAGERRDADYGLISEEVLFDLADDSTANTLYNDLIRKVRKYEPRVIVNTSATDVTFDYDAGKIEIKLCFEVIGFEGNLYSVTRAI